MARQKLSEFRAKTMLLSAFGQAYEGVSVDTNQPLEPQVASLNPTAKYVIKVDQGIKKRMKQGLVKLNRTASEVADDCKEFASKGFRYCLVEPMYPHESNSEKYLAFEFGRDGTMLSYANQGGIEIETMAGSVKRVKALPENMVAVAQQLGVPEAFITKVRDTFEASAGCFLEINPLVVDHSSVQPLDVAVEVDGEAAHMVKGLWTADDFRNYRSLTKQENAIAELASTSRASLRYEVINPDGAVWLLLSGGGASIVVADEVNNRGYGAQLGNYGEYSGNPSGAETFEYTKQLLLSLLASKSPQKVLVIAGAVANFTDVRVTFSGVIKAIEELSADLQAQHVKVYVRRGGPHQKEGLQLMEDCLKKHGLLGAVNGPELALSESVSAALETLERPA